MPRKTHPLDSFMERMREHCPDKDYRFTYTRDIHDEKWLGYGKADYIGSEAVVIRFNKNGKQTKKYTFWHFIKNPVTILNTCSKCGNISTPRNVRHRGAYISWNFIKIMLDGDAGFSCENDLMLCAGCFDKLKNLEIEHEQLDLAKKQLTCLKKLINRRKPNGN